MTAPRKPRADIGKKHKMRADSMPAQAMAYLAENGPSTEEAVAGFVRLMAETCRQNKGARAEYMALRRLLKDGLVSCKLWLTPEGLAELQRLGMAPQREGIAP